jgi:hypothetical protein
MNLNSTSKLVLLFLFSTSVCAMAGDDEHVSVPQFMVADLSEDVTGPLNAFLAAVPNGSTVRFPRGSRYRIDGTVVLDGKRSLTIDGNGVLFRAFDAGEDHDKKTSYAGWKKTRNRAHWRVRGGHNIVVRNLEVHGAHPDAGKDGTYDYNREAQHGFDLLGVENCTLENVTVHDVYGDCVYMAKVQGVVVRNSKLTRCGRQGIAVGTGEDVLIEKNLIADSRRGIIDIEPYGEKWRAGNIRIIGNRLGGSRLLLLPMGGSGTIGAVFVADNVNTEHNGTPAVANTGKPKQRRGPLLMVNNRLTVGGSPTHGLRITHNDGIFLAGNELTFPAHRKMTALNLTGSRGAVVGNRFIDAALVDESTSLDVLMTANQRIADATDAKTEWKRVQGGFAVRTICGEGEFIALMRGGPQPATPPRTIEAYGHSTETAFAWFQVCNGQVVRHGSRD